MEFPAIEQIIGLQQSDYERKFVQTEYGFGLPYYLDRLDRIMFSGGQILDAGCGVGQWSIALSQRFERVESIDLNRRRLAVLQYVADRIGIDTIHIQQGSIERLPYADNSFDGVFCYGVMMFTDVERTLSEFFRVTRPSGRIYVCLNGDGWSRYLIEERGRVDDRARRAGLTTLYSTYWHRAIRQGLISSLQKKLGILRSVTGPVPFIDLFLRLVRWCEQKFLWKQGNRKIARFLLFHSQSGMELWDTVNRYCGEEFTQTLLDDVWAILSSSRVLPPCGTARAYWPGEFEALVLASGFTDFQWSIEAGLMCDWLQAPINPKYQGTYEEELAVWECLFVKPDPDYVVPSVERHLQAARLARETPLYQGSTSSPILTSGSQWTYPLHLFEHARELATRLGGDTYLRKLACLVTGSASNEEEAVRCIICFVQGAVFRDPVSQPLTETGTIPDALTTLLCSRGRCGHVATLLVELFKQIGLEARVRQLPTHVIAEVKVAERWVIADADAFKNGVIPVNRRGRLISLEEVYENPYQLDRFPPTGWFIRPDSIYTRDVFGRKVSGYVDALDPEKRGYVSGHYMLEAKGYQPSVPLIVRFEAEEGRFRLEWTPSIVRSDRLLGYRVSVGTASRGWTYDSAVARSKILQTTATDIVSTETFKTGIEGLLPPHVSRLVASVTAYSSRIEKEPETYFWPSEEAFCELHESGQARSAANR